MSRPTRYALTFGLILACALAGCATYRDCGFKGCAGDAKITAEVRALFDQHPDLEAPNMIYVQTVDHVVYLDGLVDTPFQQQLAASVAREAAGVVRVVNSISVSNAR
ncbi:MAG: BON domain-containing protein [Steroidobacteraceae bacterium]